MVLTSVVGARPQFVKIAPLVRMMERVNAQAESAITHTLIHTGQHYDREMSEVFFEQLRLPRPDFSLGVGPASQGHQTGRMLGRIEDVLVKHRPDMVVVFGDTNSTLAGVLAASKLHIPIAHVEAGLRSFNRQMPEEVNRVVADHVSDLLLAPTPTAMQNLSNEGLASRSVFSGDIMFDAVLFNREVARNHSRALQRLQLVPGSYGLVTIHRAENTDDPERMATLLEILNEVASESLPLLFPLHPRTAACLERHFGRWKPQVRLRLVSPLDYLDMLSIVDNARIVLTDSGGVQKEAFFLSTPCVTLRDETEWIETLEAGGNVLTGADRQRVLCAVAAWLGTSETRMRARRPMATADFGEGRAASSILNAMTNFLQSSSLSVAPPRARAETLG